MFDSTPPLMSPRSLFDFDSEMLDNSIVPARNTDTDTMEGIIMFDSTPPPISPPSLFDSEMLDSSSIPAQHTDTDSMEGVVMSVQSPPAAPNGNTFELDVLRVFQCTECPNRHYFLDAAGSRCPYQQGFLLALKALLGKHEVDAEAFPYPGVPADDSGSVSLPSEAPASSAGSSLSRVGDDNSDTPAPMVPRLDRCGLCQVMFPPHDIDLDESYLLLRVAVRRTDGVEGVFWKLFVFTGGAHPDAPLCGVAVFIDGLSNLDNLYHEHASVHPRWRPDYVSHEVIGTILPGHFANFQQLCRHTVPPMLPTAHGGLIPDPAYTSMHWVIDVLVVGVQLGIIMLFPDEEVEWQLYLEDAFEPEPIFDMEL